MRNKVVTTSGQIGRALPTGRFKVAGRVLLGPRAALLGLSCANLRIAGKIGRTSARVAQAAASTTAVGSLERLKMARTWSSNDINLPVYGSPQ